MNKSGSRAPSPHVKPGDTLDATGEERSPYSAELANVFCITRSARNAKGRQGKRREGREAQKELAQSQLDARRAEERLESADGELHAYQQMAEQAITKLEGRKVTVRSSSDLYMALDSLEGRIVTANAQQRPFFRQLPPCFVTLVLRLHAGLPEAFGLRCDFVKLGAEILEHSEIRSESE